MAITTGIFGGNNMHSSVRNVGLIIFALAVLGIWVFIGCGGGGGGDGISGLTGPTGTISGTVLASSTLPSIRGISEEILAATDVGISGALVYAEDYKDKYFTTTASGGKFILSVPYGKHRIVATKTSPNGTIFKQRSYEYTISQSSPAQTTNLNLVAANRKIRGQLKNKDGQPIPNAEMYLWGEKFFTNASGEYETPPLPEGANGEIIVKAAGYQETVINATFSAPTPQYIYTTVPKTGDTNRAPVVSLKAEMYNVSPLKTTEITAAVTDPDGDTYTYQWHKFGGGTLSTNTTPLKALWTAPVGAGVATIAFVATDSKGLSGAALLGIQWGVGATASGSNYSPTVSIIASAGKYLLIGNSVMVSRKATISLVANAADNDGDALFYNWSATTGSLSATHLPEIYWTAPDLATWARVDIRVTDGKGGIGTASKIIGVDQNLATVTITSPLNKTYPAGPIEFSASAFDSAGNPIFAGDNNIFSWTLNGNPIGSNSKAFIEMIYTAGSYVAGLSYSDTAGTNSTQTVNFAINATPTSTLTAPTNGQVFPNGANITFTATGSDLEDGVLSSSAFTWMYTQWGASGTWPAFLGSGTPFSKVLPAATYTITLITTDSFGQQGASHTIVITVLGNNLPVATITSPLNNQTFVTGTNITFVGSATDIEDGNLSGTSLTWYANSVKMGTGLSISSTTVPAGTNTISLEAKDSAGGITTASINIGINSFCIASITSPASGSVFAPGETISFAGNASDPENGMITDNTRLGWFRGPWGTGAFLGSGTTLNASITVAGNHVITFGGIDSWGWVGTTSIMLVVSNRPNMSFTPASNAVYFVNTSVPFNGSGTDPDTGANIATASFRWTFDTSLQSAFNGSDTFLATFTTLGAHLVSLCGTNANGVPGTMTKQIYINATPSTQITAPAAGSRFDFGATVNFSGIASDSEDTTPGSIQFAWLDLPQGSTTPRLLVQGTTFHNAVLNYATSTFSAGSHTIYLVATDSHGVATAAGLDILINNLPVATISAVPGTYYTIAKPASVPVVLSGNSIGFVASITDVNGFQVTSTSTLWFFNGIQFDSGKSAATYTPTNADVGDATITVRLNDGYNMADYYYSLKVWRVLDVLSPLPDGATQPVGLVIKGDKLYFAASDTSKIYRYSGLTNDVLTSDGTAGGPGSNPGSFTNLMDISLDPAAGNNYLFTIDATSNRRIQGFDDLASKTSFDPANQFSSIASAVTFADSGNNVFVGAGGNIYKYSTLGVASVSSYVTSYSNVGGTAFSQVKGLRFFSSSLYVADTGLNRIFRTSVNCDTIYAPNFLDATATTDIAYSTNYLFSLASGPAIANIHVFDNTTGVRHFTFSQTGTALGQLNNPRRIFLYKDGSNKYHLFVLESSRIQRFSFGSTLW